MDSEKEQENKTTILIDDTEHVYEDMSDKQKVIIEHITDLGHKSRKAQLELDQISVAKTGFVNMLKESLAEAEAEAEATQPTDS